MKLVFVIKSINQTKGGAERVLALVANGLAARGHDVTLLTYDAPTITPSYHLDAAVKRQFLNIGIAHLPTTWAEAYQRFFITRRTIKQLQPDLVISFMYSSFVLTVLSLLGTGIKTVGSEHIVPAYYRGRPCHYPLLLLSVFLLAKMTVVTEKTIDLFPAWIRHKLIAIHNPVQLNMAASANKISSQKIILSVGRLTLQKNQQVLIKAFASLAPQFTDWQLRIIGEGELRPDLTKLIHELGMTNQIILGTATDAIEQEYAAADIFAIPSSFESFGLATAEAMLFGVPAVGFADCPGTNEIIQHNFNGLLATGLDNAQSLADCLKTLMTAADLRQQLGTNAKQTADAYNLVTVLNQWESLLTSLTHATTPTAVA